MDLYGGLMNLVKVASLLRGDPRTAYIVNEMQGQRKEDKTREQIYGPAESNGITWNGPRQTPTGNVTAATGQYPDFASGGKLPPVPRAFMPEVRQAGIEDRKQQLMGLPAYQKLAEQQMFTPPPTGKDRYLGTPGDGGVFDVVTQSIMPGTNIPKPPSDVQTALFQANNNPEEARKILASKGIKGEWAVQAATGKMQYVPEATLLGAQPGTYIRPPSGMKITSDGQGGFELLTGDQAGGASGLTKTTVGKLEDNLLQASEGYARLKAIQGQYKPEYQQLGTRWQSFTTSLKDKAGIPVDPRDRAQLEDYSAYRADSSANLTQYIKDSTGSAMGIQEGERITAGVPNPGQGLFDGDSPIEFKSKMDATMKRLGDVQMRMSYALKNGLTKEAMLAIPLDSIPQLVDQRGDAIEKDIRSQNPNMPPAQIEATVKERLRQEFGLQ